MHLDLLERNIHTNQNEDRTDRIEDKPKKKAKLEMDTGDAVGEPVCEDDKPAVPPQGGNTTPPAGSSRQPKRD